MSEARPSSQIWILFALAVNLLCMYMLIHVLYQYTVYFNILITHTLTHSHTFTKTFSPSLRPTVFHPNVAVLLQCPTTVMVLCLSSITRVYCDKITEIIYDHADFTKK